MTVDELVAKLLTFPPETPVAVQRWNVLENGHYRDAARDVRLVGIIQRRDDDQVELPAVLID